MQMRHKPVSDANRVTAFCKRGCRMVSPFAVFHFRPRSGFLLLSLFFILLLVLQGGCGFFSTRDPDPPTGTQSSGDLALTPQEALELMSSSFVLRDPNLYLRVISDQFEYSPLPSAYPEDPTFFQNWSYDREANFIHTLLAITLLPPDSLSQFSFEQINEQQWADSIDK